MKKHKKVLNLKAQRGREYSSSYRMDPVQQQRRLLNCRRAFLLHAYKDPWVFKTKGGQKVFAQSRVELTDRSPTAFVVRVGTRLSELDVTLPAWRVLLSDRALRLRDMDFSEADALKSTLKELPTSRLNSLPLDCLGQVLACLERLTPRADSFQDEARACYGKGKRRSSQFPSVIRLLGEVDDQLSSIIGEDNRKDAIHNLMSRLRRIDTELKFRKLSYTEKMQLDKGFSLLKSFVRQDSCAQRPERHLTKAKKQFRTMWNNPPSFVAQFTRCGVCWRQLSAEESIINCIGPECMKQYGGQGRLYVLHINIECTSSHLLDFRDGVWSASFNMVGEWCHGFSQGDG